MVGMGRRREIERVSERGAEMQRGFTQATAGRTDHRGSVAISVQASLAKDLLGCGVG